MAAETAPSSATRFDHGPTNAPKTMDESLHRVYVRVMGGLNGRCARSEMAVLAMAKSRTVWGGVVT